MEDKVSKLLTPLYSILSFRPALTFHFLFAEITVLPWILVRLSFLHHLSSLQKIQNHIHNLSQRKLMCSPCYKQLMTRLELRVKYRMETAKHILELSEKELESVSRVIVNPHECHVESSFYEIFAIRGIRVDRVEPGLISCTFKVPPRLTDRTGNLAVGAIANLVDILGSALTYEVGKPVNVTVDLSILYLSNAKLDDELEVTARLVGKIGAVSGTSVIIKKKTSGEIVAEGRNSMFSRLKSKI